MKLLFALGTLLAPLAFGAVHAADLNCGFTDPIAVDRNGEVLLQQYLNEEERSLTLKMTYTGGNAWVGVGVNDAGRAQMTPATVVIGWGSPDRAPTVPMTYSLSSKAPDASGVTPTISQTLQNATFIQTDSSSILTFTQSIDDFGTGNPISDDSQWIFAVGSPDNGISLHPIVGGFKLSMAANCYNGDEAVGDGEQREEPASGGIVVENIEHPERGLWVTHGILLGVAWGICAPIAIGASLLRGGFDGIGLPPGTWFKVHFFMNVLTVWMTIAGFVVAVVATNKENGAVHGAGTHHKIGLVILILTIVQAVGGKLRPGLPKPDASSENDKGLETTAHSHSEHKGDGNEATSGSDEESSNNKSNHGEAGEVKKSTARVGWEWGHRIVGLVLVVLAWSNCHTGIDWLQFNWQDDIPDSLTAVFWGVAAGISGFIVLLTLADRFTK